MTRRKVRRLLTVLLVFAMIINSVPALAQSNNSLPFSSTKGDLKTEAMNKIESGFLDSIGDGEYAEAIVYLKSQVDSMGVAKEAKSELSSALTPSSTKVEVRKEVIDALKDNAENTQQKLLKYITQEKSKGSVEEYTPYYIINAVYIKAQKDVIRNMAYMDEVEKIYKNKIVKLDEPKVSKVKIQANENGVEWNVEKVKADEVWDLGIDGTGVVVGTIDTGATWTHPALQAKWRGYNPNDPDHPNATGNWYDPINNSALPVDEPSIPHGTHVLGTILGQEKDGSNKIGVAPGAKWIAAKAFTADGGSDNNILSGAQWMLAPGGDASAAPDVINNSWGGGTGLDEWFRPMVTAWVAAGIIPVFASGNQKNGGAPVGSVSSPANYPESFAVGATDINNQRGDFSQRGPGPYHNLKPDVSAPGVNIRSSVPGGYESGWDGTSMATPAVVGTIALILSANHSLSIEEVESLLKDTAVHLEDTDDAGYPNNGYGYGLIDAFEAVSRIAKGTGTIEGKVTIEGEDTASPVIGHTQKVTETFSGSDLEISADISDDVSITDTQLLVKQDGKSYWVTLPMTRKSGDYKAGTYSGTIPSDLIKQPGISYKIIAVDYDNNEVASDEYKIVVKFGAVPDEYTTDFESNPVGWILGGDWQWGEPKEGVGPDAFSGTKLIGTNLSGNYSNSSDSILVTAPLDLRNSSLTFAQFRVNQWYDIENNADLGAIYITNNYGDTWNQVGPTYTGTGTQWKEIAINLNPYIGSSNPIYIAFRLKTNASTQKVGWYLDNAKLIATDQEVPTTPTNLSGRILFNNVALQWDASSDNDIQGYKVYRSEVADGEYTLLGETSGTTLEDHNIVANRAYYYKVAAYDYAGNNSVLTAPLTVNVGALGQYTYVADFEQNNGNFTTGGTNNSWEWGVPTSGPGNAMCGQKVWATNLSGSYQNGSNCFIESSQFQLPTGQSSVLSIGQWYELENNYDKGYIQISKKNGDSWSDWANIAPSGFITGNGMTWSQLDIPIDSSYNGKTVKIRFVLTSDGSVAKTGLYIDYVFVNTSTGVAKKIEQKKELKLGNTVTTKKETELKPLTLKLDNIKSIQKGKYTTVNDSAVQSISPSSNGLPVDAMVTVIETGKSVRTNPATGKYTLKHAANKGDETWTLKAEAYGYYPAEVKVHLGEDQVIKMNIKLEEIPKGTIAGKIVDRYSKAPVANATIRVKEDSKVAAVTSNQNGEFTIPNVYAGIYTLKVIADEFESGEGNITVVGNKTTDTEIGLKRFVGYEEEIAYDDGTGENALVLNTAGNGLAIRVTPSQYGKVKGANIFFWGDNWPSPGGTQIGITIYDTDSAGNPVKLNVKPKIVNVVRGQWNYIDLSEFAFATDRDFFIATSQTAIGTSSPGTGIDESSPYADRSYLYSGDTFKKLKDEDTKGGLMIRARMEYSVDTPEITNLKDITYTNQDNILVEGKVKADGKVNLYVNGTKTGELTTANKAFSKQLALTEERSVITVTSVLNGKETEPSAAKTVIKDKVAPELIITGPKDGIETNQRVVDITGTVTDTNFDKLELDGAAVEVINGAFHIEKIVTEGNNTFALKAYDLAGNSTEKSVTITVKKELPVITDLQPSENTYLTTGDTLTVSFQSEPGGSGAFRVVLPSEISPQSNNRIVMKEVSPGYYVGTWVAPEASVNGLRVEAEFTDNAGNTVTATAKGTINVTAEEQGIRELTPSSDVNLKAGDALTVSFRSTKGGTASCEMKFANRLKTFTTSMTEVSPGYYEWVWVVPKGMNVEGITFDVTFTDANGNTITATTAGKVNVLDSDGSGDNTTTPTTPTTPEIPKTPGAPSNARLIRS
ncbi:S8 family serine peptidase [Anaeromicropila herbilytica]|uniref:Fibronectin type-III domain-containing protein n=1 Tax=Anaeromicropila herbilytica TaxID=2785025 RepID=A0A7R7EIB9_9FIRM|nr:S8 family serine peptidase [Anaeromicropila herbilytica]BCN29308.1 hypothetical protein bsdtb5_06030 [Anaeromicropila herbilytica]